MKKSTFLKITMAFAFAVLALGVNAQVQDSDVSMSTDYAGAEGVHTEYVTVGLPYPYFAKPDPVYSPLYGSAGGTVWTINTESTWDWGLNSAADGTGTSYVLAAAVGDDDYNLTKGAGADKNKATLTINATALVGNTVYLRSTEQISDVTCTSVASSLAINVVTGPSVVLGNYFAETPATFSKDEVNGTADQLVYYSCTALTDQGLNVSLTGFGEKFDVKYAVQRADYSTGTVAAWTDVVAEKTNIRGAGTGGATLTSATLSNVNLEDDMSAYDFPFLTGGTPAVDLRTIYKIKIYTGVRDFVSMKSDDYSGGTNWMNGNAKVTATTDAQYHIAYIVLNTAPKTGPIYHLPNA